MISLPGLCHDIITMENTKRKVIFIQIKSNIEAIEEEKNLEMNSPFLFSHFY